MATSLKKDSPHTSDCIEATEDLLSRLYRDMALNPLASRNPLFLLQNVSTWMDESEIHMCSLCRSTCLELIRRERVKIWDALPNWFSLPSWDEMCEEDAAEESW